MHHRVIKLVFSISRPVHHLYLLPCCSSSPLYPLWLKPVATVLLMLCSAVFVESLVLNPSCVVMFGLLYVMYGRITYSSVFAITDRRDIGLYDVPMLMSLLGLGIGMMLVNFLT